MLYRHPYPDSRYKRKMRLLLTLLLALSIPMVAAAQTTKADLDKKELAALAALEKKYVAAKGAYTKKPKDAKLKQEYIKVSLKLANDTMVSPPLPPKVKYPKALRLYREVLKVDPKNKEATENKKMIEDIYKSMGIPIPK